MAEGDLDRRPAGVCDTVAADDRSVSEAVIDAVAAATDDSSTTDDSTTDALPPLHDAVDPDALNELCRPRDPAGDAVTVEFTYCGYLVTVESTGRVELAEP